MRILNFGSINIDRVYRVPHIVRPGETLSGTSLSTFAGGKGNNQSIALARAGTPVFHAGAVGPDGAWIVRDLQSAGADVQFVRTVTEPTGHAIIQVADSGENSIVLFPGANRTVTPQVIRDTIAHFGKGDILLLQNEINAIPEIMEAAHKAGMRIWFNPAPFDNAVADYPLPLVDCLIVNEIEAAGLAATGTAGPAMDSLARQFPRADILMTLGSRGATLRHGTREWSVPAPAVKAVDTTAAGDTFIGYYAAASLRNHSPEQCLVLACKAAAIAVTRRGAAASIPEAREVFGTN
jgi:ribokinase